MKLWTDIFWVAVNLSTLGYLEKEGTAVKYGVMLNASFSEEEEGHSPPWIPRPSWTWPTRSVTLYLMPIFTMVDGRWQSWRCTPTLTWLTLPSAAWRWGTTSPTVFSSFLHLSCFGKNTLFNLSVRLPSFLAEASACPLVFYNACHICRSHNNQIKTKQKPYKPFLGYVIEWFDLRQHPSQPASGRTGLGSPEEQQPTSSVHSCLVKYSNSWSMFKRPYWVPHRYVIFYSPFDVGYKFFKFLPIKVICAALKEIYR